MTPMRVLFRADASTPMGTGHVMRCLALAQVLRDRGASCAFLSTEQPGHLLEHIRERGFEATALPAAAATDPARTLAALRGDTVDWLVVDHYALDAPWERGLRPACRRLLAIDDLADRPHDCDLLLDQNVGRSADAYRHLVPAACRVLAGPAHAVLRPEFAELRAASLARRPTAAARKLLVTLGGSDPQDMSSRVLDALAGCALPPDFAITVVMGAKAPHLASVRAAASRLPWPTEVVVNASDMAQRMAQSDLAIGAAGTTALERCCLGLPSLVLILADNQRPGAVALAAAGAAVLLPEGDRWPAELRQRLPALVADQAALQGLQQRSAQVTDGLGAGRVAAEIAHAA